MNVPDRLPPWVAEPWYDATRPRESAVARFKKLLEVTEAILERLGIGVVACALDERGGVDESFQEKVARRLADMCDQRVSFGHWQALVALGFKGPPAFLSAAFGFESVPELGRDSAICSAHVALGGPPGAIGISNFFGVVSSVRNQFSHLHADSRACESRGVALKAALEELVVLVPALARQPICKVVDIHTLGAIEEGRLVADLEVHRGTGRPNPASWPVPESPPDLARRLGTVVLWDEPGGRPVPVPRWLIHVSEDGRLLPWNGRNGERLQYVVRDASASDDARIEVQDAALANLLKADLRRLARRDTQEIRQPTAELPNAQLFYARIVRTSLVDDGVVSPDERAELEQAALELKLPASAQAEIEADVRRTLKPSKPIPRVAPVGADTPVQTPPPIVAEAAEPDAAPPGADAPPRRKRHLVVAGGLTCACAAGLAYFLVPSGPQAGDHLSASLRDAMSHAVPPKFDWVPIPPPAGGRGFELSRAEVTVAQYFRCVGAGVCTAPHFDDGICMVPGPEGVKPAIVPDALRESTRPVSCVDFEQASAYARWAGGRLPRDDEWTWAAADGSSAAKSPPVTCEDAIVRDASGFGCGRDVSAPVCSLGHRGPFGLCDLFGNVFEWVDAEPDAEGSHTIRGGGWTRGPDYANATKTGSVKPTEPSAGIGFRLARDR